MKHDVLQLIQVDSLLEEADESGLVSIDDILLMSRKGIIEDQLDWEECDPLKTADFTSAPYWILETERAHQIHSSEDFLDFVGG